MDWLVLTISLSDYLLQRGWDGCFLTGTTSFTPRKTRKRERAPGGKEESARERRTLARMLGWMVVSLAHPGDASKQTGRQASRIQGTSLR